MAQLPGEDNREDGRFENVIAESIKPELPRGDLEEAVAEIWKDLLGLEEVYRDSNFFAVGGTSLLAIRLVARLRKALDVHVTLAELFEFATLEAFVTNIDSLRKQCLTEI